MKKEEKVELLTIDEESNQSISDNSKKNKKEQKTKKKRKKLVIGLSTVVGCIVMKQFKKC